MTKQQTGQHIIEVSVTNFMRLVEVNISPNGDEIMIKGKNGEGKTSLIEAIRRTLAGKEATKNKQPIRLGKEFAEVIVTLDNMTVSWYMSKDGKPQLKIKNNDGAYFSGPVAMLRELVGELAYNPGDFMKQHPLTQKKICLSMINTDGENIEDLDEQKKTAYDLRTESNRKANDYKTLSFDCGFIDPDTPKEEVSIMDLSNELTNALAMVNQHSRELTTKAHNEELLVTKKRIIDNLTEEMNRINSETRDLEISINTYEDPDVEHIQNKITGIEEINEKVRNVKKRNEYVIKMNEANKTSLGYTTEIAEIEKTKAYILQNANMPIDGMEFTETGIKINGVDLNRCSKSQQMTVAMGVYFNTAPTGPNAIKIVFLEDGSLLDEESLELVRQACDEKGFQLIIEKVGKTAGTNEILIEAGKVVKNE